MTTTDSHFEHDSLRTKLIQTGLHLITTEGYHNLSLRKVAKLCGVSHNAPYKHFKNKDELIQAIMQESAEQFQKALMPILAQYANQPKTLIIEMGVAYVSFMFHNPDYLQFSFMNHCDDPILLENGHLKEGDYVVFDDFKKLALSYLQTISSQTEYYDTYILSIWSTVHGLAGLLSNGSLAINEPLDVVVRRILTTTLDLFSPTPSNN